MEYKLVFLDSNLNIDEGDQQALLEKYIQYQKKVRKYKKKTLESGIHYDSYIRAKGVLHGFLLALSCIGLEIQENL